ncbi:hypothetical protein Rhe02_08900 [Rhizocola hellebori]|uniref:Uncharacterized protein n=1 Tax=Rhizocola hellebori TaxID=1392758 RepID=A0A8J3Q2Q8_9ACTN|nr:hypothetical protein [Rhizocola hellebori]GIH02823.1 hypothetical protein Rhe02_08900 [Rhizocola hellebori]
MLGWFFLLSLGPDQPGSGDMPNAEMHEASIILAAKGTGVLLVLIAMLRVWRGFASGRLERVRRSQAAQFQKAHAAWDMRRKNYLEAEWQRVDGLAEWG